MDDHARDGYRRLNAIVPLAERRDALPPAWRRAHREILAGFARDCRPPSRRDLALMAWIDDAGALLDRLAADDLAVVDAAGEIAGAYPFTTEPTPHRVTLGPVEVHAMCAVDALAIAPMLDVATRIDSVCAVTGTPVRVRMRGMEIREATPATLRVGIHWAKPARGPTAHSLCRRMLFLADAAAARGWQAEAPESRRLYTLGQAVDLGAAFFVPLYA
ncbi:MAG: alkylmercury lyase family protein [Gammaproteobacteria bacterium]|nr:alkylmercury lyase family protein [Gammaproteobacteria bacterium]